MTDLPETPAVAVDVQVMFFDTDCAAVVHNIAYLRFIETARTLLAEHLGMDLATMARTGQYPVVVRTEIDYRRPSVLGDKLRVEARLERLERIRFWCALDVVRPSDGEVLVRCRQLLALVQMPAGRPVRLPEAWAERYAHLRNALPADTSARLHGGRMAT